MTLVKKSIVTSMCMAFCVVLPMLAHSMPGAGPMLLPMHIPVLLCGLICDWPFGLFCGLAGPLLSSLLTGMPPAATLPVGTLELAAYGLVTGLMMKFVRTKSIYADLYLSLIAAMLVGRVVAGLARALIFASGSYSLALWAAGYFVTSFPGLLIQIALLPSIVCALESARLIPKRYPLSADAMSMRNQDDRAVNRLE